MTLSIRVGAGREDFPISVVSTDRSLEQAVGGARLRSFERRPDLLGEAVEIEINGQRQFTGVLEQAPGNPERGYEFTARSLPVALRMVDADRTERFKNTTTAVVASALAARVGVQVGETVSELVASYRLQRGRSYQRALLDLAEAHGFIVTDDPLGRLRLYQLPELKALEVWQHGTLPVIEISEEPDIREWRDVVQCRGYNSPEANEVADVLLGQIGQDIVVGNIRPSRRVIPNRTARSKAQARILIANEARRSLAGAYTIPVDLTETTRQPGDLVRVRRDDINLNLLMVVSTLRWDIGVNTFRARAICRLPEVYGSTGLFSPREIERART